MKRIGVWFAAAAAAAALAAGATGATQERHEPQTQKTTHHVQTAKVVAVQEVRAAVWACQRTIGAPATRAELDVAGLRAAGGPFLTWITHRWSTTLTGCRKVEKHRQAIVSTLRRGLHGYPLEQWSARFEQAGRRWDVSPYFMAAIAGQESTFGKFVTPGNAWGIGPGKWFADFGEGIDYLAQMLATRYNLSSIESVGGSYCPGCGEWPGKVGWFLGSSFGQSTAALRYPKIE